jgi:hypothetical protein
MRIPEHKAAIRIVQGWCQAHGIIMEPLCGADLVARMATGIKDGPDPRLAAKARNRSHIASIAHPEGEGV